MRNCFFVLLLFALIFVGCNKQPPKQTGTTPDGTDAAAVPTLGVPMPTAEILAALGPENNIPIQHLLPNPIFVVTGKPKQFLASPAVTGGELLVADLITQGLQLYHFDPNDIEWFVQSSGFPMWVSAPQDPNAYRLPEGMQIPSDLMSQRKVPVARRATLITFEQPRTLMEMLGIADPAVLETLKRTEGKNEYYDLTPPGFDGPLRVAIGQIDEKTAVFVEGSAEDITAVFSDAVPKNAVLERLKHTPVDANELTVISSLEGLPMSPELFEKLLEQVGQAGTIPSSVLALINQHLRALTLSLKVSAATGQPIISIYMEGRDATSAEVIGTTIQGLLLHVQTSLAAMSEEEKATLPIPADFADSLLKATTVDVKETRIDVVLNNFETLIPAVAERLSTVQTALHHEQLQQNRIEQLRTFVQLFAMYYQAHQKFPADIVDANGKPLLSWRVALLPIMGLEELYNKFKLDEPWDSEANLEVLNTPNSKPIIFHPMTEDVNPPKTVVRFFDSPGTPFSKKDLKIEDLKSPETTLMFVVVTPQYAVEWTKPDSLAFDLDKLAEMLGTPQFWGVTFSGQIIHSMTALPNTDPQYNEWKQYIEGLIKPLPVEAPQPAPQPEPQPQEPVAEPVVEPVAEPVAEPAAEPVVEPVVEPASEATPQEEEAAE